MRQELDSKVLDIEFVIIAVVQGVALTFLAENAAEPIGNLVWQYWFYIISAFIFLLIFWSQAIIHALSFVKWPMRLGHSFLYFLASFVEVLVFTQVTHPLKWFAAVFGFFVVAGVLYAYDLSLIKSEKHSFQASKESRKLYDHILNQQKFEMKVLIPAGLIFNLAAFLLIWMNPKLFIDQNYHIVIAAIQTAFSSLILYNSISSFSKRSVLISQAKV